MDRVQWSRMPLRAEVDSKRQRPQVRDQFPPKHTKVCRFVAAWSGAEEQTGDTARLDPLTNEVEVTPVRG